MRIDITFTLIQKFNIPDAAPIYPDHDIIIMSDEAHRRTTSTTKSKTKLSFAQSLTANGKSPGKKSWK